MTQHPKEVSQQVSVVSMAAQLVHNALGRGQRHHADAERPGAGSLQRARPDPGAHRRDGHAE